MFRRFIPLAIATLVMTGAFAANAAGAAPSVADGTCPPIEVTDNPPESLPPESTPDTDDLDSRCDIDPLAYYLGYQSPEYDEDSATAGHPTALPTTPTTGAVLSAEAVDQAAEPLPQLPEESGPLDDNVFVDEGDSHWVETESDRESTFALDVDTGSFNVAQQFLSEGYLPDPASIRPEEWINAFDYGDEPAADGALDVTIDSTTQGPDGTALVRLGISTAELDPIERPRANITFVCAAGSHINVDEAGAAERILGAKLFDVPAPDGKIRVEQIAEIDWMFGNEHHVQPAVLSITQSTELGTVYSPDEVAALCSAAHRRGMRVHMDGARIANATAALGSTHAALRSFTVDAGVDVLTFGGTKNGLLGGEAVIFLAPDLAERARYLRKVITQLPSKMRYIAAQFLALLRDDLWLRNAEHSNAMAAALYDGVAGLPDLAVERPQVNSLFPTLPAELVAPLRDWSFFWDWDVAKHQVRWMTAWDTTAEDVDRFVDGVTFATRSDGPGELTN